MIEELSSFEILPARLHRRSWHRVLFVKDVVACNAAAEFLNLDCLANFEVVEFSGFQSNPAIGDVQRGLSLLEDRQIDALLAIGGGTAIDLAKLIACACVHKAPPNELFDSGKVEHGGLPIVAVPTTAGTGSEATQFAVVYIDGVKHSVSHPSLVPQIVVLDPRLTYSLPPRLTAATGLDAFCQAMESLWSVRSTEESRDWAAEALDLSWRHLHDAVHRPDPASRAAMMHAAHLAGKAINVSRTTAPHAVSYHLTSRYGIPHGFAVALSIVPFLRFNAAVSAGDCRDPRGVAHVHPVSDDIVRILGTNSVEDAAVKMEKWLESLSADARSIGGDQLANIALEAWLDEINVERLDNNPRALNRAELRRILQRIVT